MSRIGQIIKKNMLLLLRSRSSAFVILFGPLAIILLIGLAFTNTGTGAQFSVGYFSPEESPLLSTFVTNMEDNGFHVTSFTDQETCIDNVELSALQTCIVFPSDFSIKDNKVNTITFFVDQSRTNFVFQIIDSVSSNFGLASAQLSENLTTTIIEVLWDAQEGVDAAADKIVSLKTSSADVISDAKTAASEAGDIDFSTEEVDEDVVAGYFETLSEDLDDLYSDADNFLDDSLALESELEGAAYSSTAFDDFSDAIVDFDEVIDTSSENKVTTVEHFEDALDELLESIDAVNEKLVSADDANKETIKQIAALQKSGESLQEGLSSVKTMLEEVSLSIDSLAVTSSETITKPIKTDIEYVSGKNNRLSFMFPYLLMLVVMFVGLLLSGTLIVMEKKSKSSFRTFCTPVRDEMLMLGNFLTSFIIVFIQVAVIVGIAYYFLGDVLLGNLVVGGVLLLLGMVLFIILGMVLGYLLNSQESVTMIAISIGSVSLFLSNLILPLETLSEQLQMLTSYNPYVITSEAIRKALLFNISHVQLQWEFIMLMSYSLGMLILLILTRHMLKSSWYQHISVIRHNKMFDDPSDAYLKVDGENIKDLKEFAAWLEVVDDATFDAELTWYDIRSWMKRNNMNKHLRFRLAGKSREQMMLCIEKFLDKRKD